MAEIVLTTLNARYAHASFGLRYLMSNLRGLGGRAKILEFEISHRPTDVVERIVAENPRIVGLGVYIWNAQQSAQVVADLKRIRPEITVILGGPEVSYESDRQEIVGLADYTITGEGDIAFAELCEKILSGRRPLNKVIAADLPHFEEHDAARAIELPYHLYSDEDIAHRVIYVEASRGCPFECEFCLSSLDIPVRNVPVEKFLAEMDKLLGRGARHFKFVDRTFNLNLNTSRRILEFCLERYRPGLFFHFEMIPDRLPEGLRQLIRQFPPGALQFEVGVQTFDEEVAARISRRQNNAKLEENLRFLRLETGVHVHADLIAGLPGEDEKSFAAGFDRLLALGPQEIQVGILKRLRGTPISRHDQQWKMVYSPYAPYEVLQTGAIDFASMQRLKRFARIWDIVGNSGNFVQTLPMLWKDRSAYAAFMEFSESLYAQTGRTHGLALQTVAEILFEHLAERGNAREVVAESMWRDWQRGGRREIPEFLRPFVAVPARGDRKGQTTPLSRQARHLG